jgi:hypothetical protein
MVSPGIDAESLRVLGQDWKVNLIRSQLIRSGRVGQTTTPGQYDAWLEGEVKRLDAVLPLCEKYGLLVVVDLHSPPGGKATVGGYLGSDGGLFSDRQVQEKFVEVWRRIATRYKDTKAIWGYDLKPMGGTGATTRFGNGAAGASSTARTGRIRRWQTRPRSGSGSCAIDSPATKSPGGERAAWIDGRQPGHWRSINCRDTGSLKTVER